MSPELLLGPLGLVVAALIVILAAVKRPPLWYTPSAYDAKCAECDRIRTEAAETVKEWKQRYERMERLALMQAGVLEKSVNVAERAVKVATADPLTGAD